MREILKLTKIKRIRKKSLLVFNVRSLIHQEKKVSYANIENTFCFDIIFITEPFSNKELLLDTFELYPSDRNHNSAHGGVLIGIKCNHMTKLYDFDKYFRRAVTGCSLLLHERFFVLFL